MSFNSSTASAASSSASPSLPLSSDDQTHSNLSIPSLQYYSSSSSSSSAASDSSSSSYVPVPVITSSSLTDHTLYRSVAVESYPASTPLVPGFEYPSQNESLGQFDSFGNAGKNKDLYSFNMNPKTESFHPTVVVSSTSANDDESAFSIPPPSPPGGYIEPSTHFFTNTSPLSTLKDLVSHLEVLSVDCTYVVEQFKIKCVAYNTLGSRVEFVVRVWNAEEQVKKGGCKFAVEFQRRFGDGFYFFQIYDTIKKQIAGGHSEIQLCCPMSTTRALFECPPLPADVESEAISMDAHRESLNHLLAMCSCECVDVKSQALSAICEMSRSPELKPLLLDSGCLELFITNLFCGYSDVHRLALTGIANLTHDKNKSVCEQVFRSNAKDGVRKCIGSECAQVVRESARTLANLFEALGESCYEDEEWKSCVETLAGSTDGQAQKHIQTMMETLSLS